MVEECVPVLVLLIFEFVLENQVGNKGSPCVLLLDVDVLRGHLLLEGVEIGAA